MKLEINTDDKTIKFESAIKVVELIETVKKLFPDDWEEYKVEVSTFNWLNNPTIINRSTGNPILPWQQPHFTAINDIVNSNKLNINENNIFEEHKDITTLLTDYSNNNNTYQIKLK
jgi:hypothetical protein